ncbi:MAG: sugar transferase [Gemmatimonadaceae bacterium]|nr:sugar transferase [Gloeobacterales cyanobacterium ES-bin-141]
MVKLSTVPQRKSSQANFKSDLRAPIFTGLRRGLGAGWLRITTLILLDSVLLSAAWQLAEALGSTRSISPWNVEQNPLSLLPILVIVIGLMATEGLYQSGSKRRDYLGLTKAVTFAHILLLLIAFFYRPGIFVSRITFVLAWFLSAMFILVGRFGINIVVEHFRKQGTGRYPVFMLGHPQDTQKAVHLLAQENRYNILGSSDVNDWSGRDWEAVLEKICSLRVTEVFVCSWDSVKDPMFLYWSLRNAGITLHILPVGFEPVCQKAELQMIGGLPCARFSPPLVTGSDFWVKRSFDILATLSILVFVSPLYLLIMLLIKLDSPGPLLYKQDRVGLKGHHFKIWKFRSMVVNAEKMQKELEEKNEMKDGFLFKMKEDPRVTRVGKFLRRYSLDELPQLFNVLLGDMSLVGPRPFSVHDSQKFEEHHFIRNEVLPGLTGLWQVSGRSDITDFEQVVRLDVTYIESWSLWLDWQILLKTIRVVLQRSGAY